MRGSLTGCLLRALDIEAGKSLATGAPVAAGALAHLLAGAAVRARSGQAIGSSPETGCGMTSRNTAFKIA